VDEALKQFVNYANSDCLEVFIAQIRVKWGTVRVCQNAPVKDTKEYQTVIREVVIGVNMTTIDSCEPNEYITIEEARSDSSSPMYSPKGKLLKWLRTVFNTKPKKYVIRTKQRDPFNYGNPEGRLYDREIFVCNTKDELIAELLSCANHMSSDVMYLTQPNGKVVYAAKTASGGFKVDKDEGVLE
jgi:hypothetical protein